MKVVIAMDSFKGSLTSIEAGNAVKRGILKADPNADIIVRPLADGGEGTVDALIQGMHGTERHADVSGPAGDPVDCKYGILPDHTAVIEMAAAAGLTLIPPEKRNPLYTTTYGVGEAIRDAIQHGCRNFMIGIGGSGTNDGGVGMLEALGYSFLDQSGKEISQGAIGLKDLAEINTDSVIPELSECSFRIACDVDNPLCGANGCSAVYGPQKGADAEMIEKMDRWLFHYAELCRKLFPESSPDYAGSGAAGGLGFAFHTFLHGKLESGVRIVLEETHLEDEIRDADFAFTGEGRIDAQTTMGKAPGGLAKIASRYGIPVIAFAGSVSEDAFRCNQQGITAYFPILRNIVSLDEAMKHENAERNLMDTAEQIFRLITAVRKDQRNSTI